VIPGFAARSASTVTLYCSAISESVSPAATTWTVSVEHDDTVRVAIGEGLGVAVAVAACDGLGVAVGVAEATGGAVRGAAVGAGVGSGDGEIVTCGLAEGMTDASGVDVAEAIAAEGDGLVPAPVHAARSIVAARIALNRRIAGSLRHGGRTSP